MGKSRLTLYEQRTILKLHNEGKKISEIVKEVGRSREAITNLFVMCGIGDGSIRLQNLIWYRAEKMYDKQMRRNNPNEKYCRFKDLAAGIQNDWYAAARKEYMVIAQKRVDDIMAEDTPTIEKKQVCDCMNICIDEKTKKELDTICDSLEFTPDCFVKFLICREYLDMKRNGMLKED